MSDDRYHLTHDQAIATTTLDRAFVLTAAAGSGKTTVLVERFLQLIQSGALPSSILAVTFTNEAADQLRERVVKRLHSLELLDDDLIRQIELSPRIGTLHSFCYRLLDEYGTMIGFEPVEKILSAFEFSMEFNRFYDAWLDRQTPEDMDWLLTHYTGQDLKLLATTLYRQRFAFQRAIAHSTSASYDQQLAKRLAQLMEPLWDDLQGMLFYRGWYSFDELEELSLKILNECPQITERIQKEIRHLLVDEFQDTSALQWEILQKVIGNEPQKLFVVGDPKQSIYGFRNAEVRVFLNAQDNVAEWNGMVHELATNFRSQPETLDAINDIASRIFTDSSVPFQKMVAGAQPFADGQTGLFHLRYGEEGLEIEATKDELFQKELAIVTQSVEQRLKTATPESIVLLFRAADRIAEFANTFAAKGWPVSAHKSGLLWDHNDAQDLLQYLKAVLNPLDDFSLSAFLRSPYVGYSYQQLWDLKATDPKSPIYYLLLKSGNASLNWFHGLIESGVFECRNALHQLFAHSRHFPKQAEVLTQILKPLTSEPQMPLDRAVEILESAKKESILLAGRESAGEAGIRLMTVHAAKGLEFQHVYLVDNLRATPNSRPLLRLQPKYPPGLRYRVDGEWVTPEACELLDEIYKEREREESKRILYVALTRAIETVTISLPANEKWIRKESWASWLLPSPIKRESEETESREHPSTTTTAIDSTTHPH